MGGKARKPPVDDGHHPEVLGDTARSEFSDEATAPPDTTDHSWGGGVFGAAASQPLENRGRPAEERGSGAQAIRASARAASAVEAEAEPSEVGGASVLLAAVGGAVVAIGVGVGLLWGLGVL